jgi:hypothetical protein
MDTLARNTVNSSRTIISIDQRKSANGTGVLRELFELLEDYAPSWYTEELHNRAAAVLGEFYPQTAVH